VGGQDASVVDEDRGRAQCSPYLLGDRIHGFGVGDVAFEELDVCIYTALISSTSSCVQQERCDDLQPCKLAGSA
jgi:hypothetical protein